MWYSNRAQWFFLVAFFSVWILETSPQYRRPRVVVVLSVLGGILAWTLYRHIRRLAVLTPPTLMTPDAQYPNDALNAEYASQCQTCGESIHPKDRRCRCGTPIVSNVERGKYDGLGGWLGLFVFGLFVGKPLSALTNLTVALHDAFSGFTEFLTALPETLLIGTSCAYGIFVGVQLTRRTAGALRHARVFLILSLVVTGITMLLGERPGKASDAQIFKSWAVYGIPLTWVWVAYFRRSRRVLVTYGADAFRENVSRRLILIGIVTVILILAIPTLTLTLLGLALHSTRGVSQAGHRVPD